MVCGECGHECTRSDFFALRNLCEHLYLDALAKKYISSCSQARSRQEARQKGFRKTQNHIMRSERKKSVLETID